MSALAYTAEQWGAKMAAAMTDQGYRTISDLGRLAARYVDQLKFEDYADESIANREPVLRLLAIDFIGRNPADITTDDLRLFLARHWAEATRGTKANRTTHVRTFFKWLDDNGHIPANPAARIRSPRKHDTSRQSHQLAKVRQLVSAQPQHRDRICLELLYWLGLRRNEIRLMQFKHFNYRDLTVVVYGKGGKVVEQSIPGELALQVEMFQRERDRLPTDYLLHAGRENSTGRVMWERPAEPMSPSGIYRWWKRCLERAGLEHFVMHEIRHTAGTHFYQASGHDLLATQRFMRHQDPGTTARHYIHLNVRDEVARVQRGMESLVEE